jgi:hypothetical protein
MRHALCSIHHSTNHAPILSAALIDPLQHPSQYKSCPHPLCCSPRPDAELGRSSSLWPLWVACYHKKGLLVHNCSSLSLSTELQKPVHLYCTVHVYHLPGRTFNQRLFALSFLSNGQFLLQMVSFIDFFCITALVYFVR